MLNKFLKKLGFLLISCALSLFVTPELAYSKTSKKSLTKKAQKAEAAAVSPAQNIQAIEITGQKKIEKEAIISHLKSKVGGTYSEALVAEDIKALFKLGFFVQIEVSKDGQNSTVSLEYKVSEKPTVSEIIFEGNNEIKSDDLAEQINLKQYEILNYDKIKDSVAKIEKQYEDKGFYLVKVEPIVSEVKDETVTLKFNITENDKVKVKKITFIGNQKLQDNFLKDQLFTQEAGFFSGMSSSGSFKQEAFERDL